MEMTETKKKLFKYLGINVLLLPDKLPIDNTYGSGFEFTLKNGKTYKTRPDLTEDGKLNVQLNISSFSGIVSYATHYYGQILVRVDNVSIEKPSHIVAGYLDGIEIPKEYSTLDIHIGRPVTEEELAQADNKDSEWFGYEEGCPTMRSNSYDELIKTANEIFPMIFDPDKCIMKIQ